MADADEFGDFTQSEVVNVWADLTPDSEATGRTNKEPAADEGSGKKDDDDEDDFGDFVDATISCSIDVQPVPPASLGHKPDRSLAPRLWDIIWPQPDSHANLIQELDTDRGDLVQAYLRLADLSRNQ
ncbi:hypothetical protein FBU59_004780 [Linderina macrospora]|uniref:Uncharacterized protein n=1 Tax=Linderina macrospora TaxID=4868 RepID=A0ACC1J4L8_9FUNG|nr:hypothetical protein FBU59_004780 [Linderina macrospora]